MGEQQVSDEELAHYARTGTFGNSLSHERSLAADLIDCRTRLAAAEKVVRALAEGAECDWSDALYEREDCVAPVRAVGFDEDGRLEWYCRSHAPATALALDAVGEKPETLRHCVFCDLIGSGEVYADLGTTVVVEPLNPVTPGHLLVIPKSHVADAVERAMVTGQTMADAARVAEGVGPCNLITSVGEEATQSVFHLHIHIVPRRRGDGLKLPWTDQAAVGEKPNG